MSKTTEIRPAAPVAETAAEAFTELELRELQLERLQWTVRHAYENVPLYRRKFTEAGVTPDDIRTLEDVRRLPFTTKDDSRETYPFGMFAVPMDQVRRLNAPSVTTGPPTSARKRAGVPTPGAAPPAATPA